jgi:hypothetical protein
MDCPDADVAFVCNAQGKCAAEAPNCGNACMTAMDCPPIDICYQCPGVGGCVNISCVNGRCGFECPEPPEPTCMTAMDCSADTICRVCPDMSCATTECVNGRCASVCPL